MQRSQKPPTSYSCNFGWCAAVRCSKCTNRHIQVIFSMFTIKHPVRCNSSTQQALSLPLLCTSRRQQSLRNPQTGQVLTEVDNSDLIIEEKSEKVDGRVCNSLQILLVTMLCTSTPHLCNFHYCGNWTFIPRLVWSLTSYPTAITSL